MPARRLTAPVRTAALSSQVRTWDYWPVLATYVITQDPCTFCQGVVIALRALTNQAVVGGDYFPTSPVTFFVPLCYRACAQQRPSYTCETNHSALHAVPRQTDSWRAAIVGIPVLALISLRVVSARVSRIHSWAAALLGQHSGIGTSAAEPRSHDASLR